MPASPLRLAVLISGGGTTLWNLLQKQRLGLLPTEIVEVVSSNPRAGGLGFAAQNDVPAHVVNRQHFSSVAAFSEAIFDRCRRAAVDYVIMGGFLKLVEIPADFTNRVVNIHPSLLPAFGGRGFYGLRVHQAVLDYGCKLSGCTIHFVNNEYDRGPIIHQQAVPVADDDTPESLAARVHVAECQAYPRVISWLAGGRVSVVGRLVKVAPEPAEPEGFGERNLPSN